MIGMTIPLLLVFLIAPQPSKMVPSNIIGEAWTGYDIPAATWHCLKEKYRMKSLVLHLYNKGEKRTIARQMSDAMDAGYTDIGGEIAASPDMPPAKQVYDDVLNYLYENQLSVNFMWIAVYVDCCDLNWSQVTTVNIVYLKQLVSEGLLRGLPVGIRTSSDAWRRVTASSDDFSSLPLWCEEDKDVFRPFAGWTTAMYHTIGGWHGFVYCSHQISLATSNPRTLVTCNNCERNDGTNCKANETCTGGTCTTQKVGSRYKFSCSKDWFPDGSCEFSEGSSCCNDDRCNVQ